MELGVILAFWGVAMIIIVVPGADWAYAITGGMHHRATPAVLGMLTGHSIGILVVAAGVGAVVTAHPAALGVLTLVGAASLMYLGVGSLLRPGSVGHGAVGAGSGWSWWMKGVGVSGMNPKVLLLFLAILPQFTQATASWPVGGQMLLLGGIHLVSTAAVYFAVGFSASAVLSSRPAAARLVSRLSGGAMLLIGAGLLTDQFLH